jgi:hypothetical protein
MRMFGGFSPEFFEEYHKHRPKSKPVGEYDMRQMLYELFHYVRFIFCIFGLSALILTRVMFLAESHLHLSGRQDILPIPVLLLKKTPLDYLLC